MCHSIHRITIALTVTAWMLIFGSNFAVRAQHVEIPAQAATHEVMTEMPASEQPAPSPGYWIVGSHGSPQSFNESPPSFCPTVTRYDHCVGFRRSDMPELAMSIQPGAPVCIFCHGSFVSWEDVLNESRETWKWLHHACPNQPIQMIYFTWPSDRPVFSPVIQLDVNRLGRRAGRNGFYLANLVQQIHSECPVCLMGHSHGTRVIASSLHLMGGGAVENFVLTAGPHPQHRIRGVFAASAIDHNWMNPGDRYDCALCSVECILNLQNQCDAALLIYPLRRPFSGGALGFTGVTRKDRMQLGPWRHKIQDLDLSEEIGPGHYWPNYFSRPWLAQAVRYYLYIEDNTSLQ